MSYTNSTNADLDSPPHLTHAAREAIAIERDLEAVLKFARSWGSALLLEWYECSVADLDNKCPNDAAKRAAELDRIGKDVAVALVKELKKKADAQTDAQVRFQTRVVCNRVIEAARRWLPEEALCSL